MEALRIATHNPTEFYGLEPTIGAISAGQKADLVLLDRDPLDNIRNTGSISAVVSQGRLYDGKQLKELLETAARSTEN
jgi:imidazolonepropionase-like amidohydrolase